MKKRKILSLIVLSCFLLAFSLYAGGKQEQKAIEVEEKKAIEVEEKKAEVVMKGQAVIYGTLSEFEKITGKKLPKYTEAPELAAKVKAGELPPVEQRLPDEPVVLDPRDEIGVYGGDLIAFMDAPFNAEADAWSGRLQNLLGPSTDLVDIVPNIAKAYDISDDGKTITFYLRKGLKWSDGAPFTADDFLFWYEDFVLNEKLMPFIPKHFTPGGQAMKVIAEDDYTVHLQFAVPNTSFVVKYARPDGNYKVENLLFEPKHYLKQFHIKYNPDANELAKKEGFEEWSECLLSHVGGGNSDRRRDVNYPTVEPWVLSKIDSIGNKYFDRNPYYWKVDSAGQQLPYLDRQVVKLVESMDVIGLKVIAGEASIACYALTLDNYTVYKENEKQGGYRTFLWDSNRGAEQIYAFNLTVKDPVLRKIFNDIRFRQAASLAINREQIAEVVFHGRAKPRQATTPTMSTFYEDWMELYMAEYDTNRANELLDEMGLKWDRNHEYRLRPDGKRLTIVLDYFREEGPKMQISELLKIHWKIVGIDLFLKEEERTIYTARGLENEFHLSGKHLDNIHPAGLIWDNCSRVTPGGAGVYNSQAWFDWYQTDGKEGEEPPEEIKELFRWCDEYMVTMLGTEKSDELGRKILTRHVKGLYEIGTVGPAPQPVVAKNGLMNVPEKDVYWPEGAWMWNTLQETWFWKK